MEVKDSRIADDREITRVSKIRIGWSAQFGTQPGIHREARVTLEYAGSAGKEAPAILDGFQYRLAGVITPVAAGIL